MSKINNQEVQNEKNVVEQVRLGIRSYVIEHDQKNKGGSITIRLNATNPQGYLDNYNQFFNDFSAFLEEKGYHRKRRREFKN